MSQSLSDLLADHELEAAALNSALGSTVARWSSVEWSLSQIFWHSLGRPDSSTSTTAFFAVHAFHSKLKMVNDPLILRYKGTPLVALWQPVHQKLTKASGVRNNLAHSPTTLDAQQPKGRRLFINVGALNPATSPTFTGRNRSVYYEHDLQAIEKSFKKLSADVSMFQHIIERFLEGKSIT